LELLNRERIRVIPLKGPSLTLSLYGNLALRPIGDLDILVRPRDIDAVKRLLVNDDYRPDTKMNVEKGIRRWQSEYHWGFESRQGVLRVEIHREILPRSLRRRMDINTIWNCATPSKLATQPTLALPPEELLLVLCVHAQKHEWQRLKWIGDIARLIEAYPQMDWVNVMRRAVETDQKLAILQGFFLAASLLRVELPQPVLGALRSDASLTAWAGLILGRLFRSGHNLPGLREWLAYVRVVSGSCDELPARIELRALWRYLSAIVAPESRDRFEVPVPRIFSFVHYVHRPARLFRRHGVDLFERLR
jgi:hypothetical protein